MITKEKYVSSFKKVCINDIMCKYFGTGAGVDRKRGINIETGGQAFYDTALDITWAADANLNGSTDWNTQQTWVSGLTIDGVGGWRLPNADVNGDNTIVNCSGGGVAGCSDNEMGYLYWQKGITTSAPGLFTNVQSNPYYSGTDSTQFSDAAWVAFFSDGRQNQLNKQAYSFFRVGCSLRRVGASSVPEPGTVALMRLGLAGLLGFARRQRRL